MLIIGAIVVNFRNFYKLFKLKLCYNPQKGYNLVKSMLMCTKKLKDFNFCDVASTDHLTSAEALNMKFLQ